MNNVQLLGRIGQDPELNYTQSGMAVGKFSLATNKKIKGEDKTSWHRCVAFQQTAELIGKYVNKGDQLCVEGEISYGSYDKDGVKVYTTDIVVNRIHFVSAGKKQNQGNQQQYQKNPPKTQQQSQGNQVQPQNQPGNYQGNQQPEIDSDIPF